MFSGGLDDEVDEYYDTILKYDLEADTFTEAGHMKEARADHAISVVLYSEYSEHCEFI